MDKTGSYLSPDDCTQLGRQPSPKVTEIIPSKMHSVVQRNRMGDSEPQDLHLRPSSATSVLCKLGQSTSLAPRVSNYETR